MGVGKIVFIFLGMALLARWSVWGSMAGSVHRRFSAVENIGPLRNADRKNGEAGYALEFRG